MRPRVILALGIVYLVWGSTYLAVMVGIETFPPLLMSSLRFAVAGGLLYAWSIRRGDAEGDRPGPAQWLSATAIGGLLLVIDAGGIAWAEQRVPSGLTALIVACVPIFVAVLQWSSSGKRLTPVGALGLVAGLAGVAFLVGPGGEVDPVGAVVIVIGAAAWAAGTVFSPRLPLSRRPLVAASMQMLTASVLLAVAGVSAGELSQLHAPTAASLAALAYLIVAGSIVAYTAYVWLLSNATTSLVSTFAYVNPIVAVALGAAILGEDISRTTVLAGVAILGAVVLILRGENRDRGTAVPDEKPEGELTLEPALREAA
jgi:drug/metabolite transporter (DMT)-like permease